ncbi:DUF4396 domain-containing protein [Kytococcus sedentarius]|uniref:DUF4396 domain-containing protein n=1 Tax=Kytococcus sedentarius TaxID=1276 RepID=UPI0035BC63A5
MTTAPTPAAHSHGDAHGDHASHDMSGMAASATLHCLTGCAIGEISGLVIGTALGWHMVATTALAIGLAFLFGYSLSALPLVRAGIGLGAAISLVLAADTLSILTMEVVDNAVMWLIPGAMGAFLDDWLFWVSMGLAFLIAFAAAYPVNRHLLKRGKGHAVTHHALGEDHQMDNRPLTLGLVAFLAGGLVASVGGLF